VEVTTVTHAVSYTAYYQLLTYSIGAIADQTLSPVVEGYGSDTQQEKTLTITRTGTGNLKHLAVALGGSDGDSFEVTQPGASELNDSAPSTTFTVKAKDGLFMSTYIAQVTITADDMAPVTFTATQVVNENTAAKHSVTVVISDGQNTVAGASVTLNGLDKTTDTDGKAVYELANGTYGFSIGKTGYTTSAGNIVITKDTSVICLVITKTGDTVLPDNDGDTAAIVIAGDGDVPESAILMVDQVDPDQNDDDAVSQGASEYHIATLLDIRRLLGNVTVQPDRPVTVGIPVPKNLQGKALMVVRINDDGTVTKFQTTMTGNLLFFTTDHFSRYAILAANEDNPDTGEAGTSLSPVVPVTNAVLVLLVLALALVAVRKKRKA
jgi:hypothetical protein